MSVSEDDYQDYGYYRVLPRMEPVSHQQVRETGAYDASDDTTSERAMDDITDDIASDEAADDNSSDYTTDTDASESTIESNSSDGTRTDDEFYDARSSMTSQVQSDHLETKVRLSPTPSIRVSREQSQSPIRHLPPRRALTPDAYKRRTQTGYLGIVAPQVIRSLIATRQNCISAVPRRIATAQAHSKVRSIKRSKHSLVTNGGEC